MNAVEAAVRHDDDQVAVARLARQSSRRCRRRSGCAARGARAAADVAHELVHRQPLVVRQRARKTAARIDFVGAGLDERAREVVLEHAPARRRRPRLEDRPDAAIRIRPAHARAASRESPSDDARSRRRPTRRARCPAVRGGGARRGIAPGPRCIVSGVSPAACPTASAASALRTLCSPSSGSVNVPERLARVRHVERACRRPTLGCPTRASRRPRVEAERLDRRSRARRPAAAPRGCRRRESARPLPRHQIRRSRRNAVAQRLHVRVDVRVVVFEVADDGDVRQVLQELRRLVEERAVVLVAFDDEVAARTRADSCRRSSPRCRRRARSDRGRRPSAASPSATSSSSCRACRR